MKNKLVSNFIIGTFVSLYALVSIVSTIHVVDFFELSNPTWLAITLAIGFEIGAAASLASLVILKKMNKTLVWSLFIAITLMQMQGNMYYAFINLGDFASWSELFDLMEEDLIYQKRILAFVSGAILPLVALGFIKSLVDYIKPEDEYDEEIITSGTLGDNINEPDPDKVEGFEKEPTSEYFEDIALDIQNPKAPTGVMMDATVDKTSAKKWADLADQLSKTEPELEDIDVTFDHIKIEEPEDVLTEEEKEDMADFDSVINDGLEEEFDEDHALDMAMNDMVKDFTPEDIETIVEANENPPVPNQKLKEAADNSLEINPTSVGAIVEKIPTPHLPHDEPVVKTEDQLWKEAMAKKAKEEMETFIKNKNASK